VPPLGTSYGAYNISKALPPGEHHKRKLLREAGAVNYSYGGEYLILTSQFRCSLGFRGNIKWCNINCILQGAVGAACYYGGNRLRSRES